VSFTIIFKTPFVSSSAFTPSILLVLGGLGSSQSERNLNSVDENLLVLIVDKFSSFSNNPSSVSSYGIGSKHFSLNSLFLNHFTVTVTDPLSVKLIAFPIKFNIT